MFHLLTTQCGKLNWNWDTLYNGDEIFEIFIGSKLCSMLEEGYGIFLNGLKYLRKFGGPESNFFCRKNLCQNVPL